jgi:hypothetical protein
LLGGAVCDPARDIVQARLQAIRVPLDLVRDQVEHLQSGRIRRSRIIRHGRKFPHLLRRSYTIFIKSNTRSAQPAAYAETLCEAGHPSPPMEKPMPAWNYEAVRLESISTGSGIRRHFLNAGKNTSPHSPNVGK